MPPNQARDYRQLLDLLSQIDPAGRRPLFAFGYTGGFNYFLGRPNSTPLTQGFRLSNADPEEVVESLLNQVPPPILLFNPVYSERTVPVTTLTLSRWETPFVESQFTGFDRKYFEQVRQHCPRVPPKERMFFTLYDCAP
jgi:hypothetical protein